MYNCILLFTVVKADLNCKKVGGNFSSPPIFIAVLYFTSINGENGEIIAVHEEKGSIHDMEIFKRSNTYFAKDILSIGDKGYQGLILFICLFSKSFIIIILNDYNQHFHTRFWSDKPCFYANIGVLAVA